MVMPPRVDLVDRQAVFVELDDRDMAEGVGDAPLVDDVEVGEAVVVQPAVAPGVVDPPAVAMCFVAVVKRQAVAVGVAHHAVGHSKVGLVEGSMTATRSPTAS
jgi:hypothetical protein